MHEPRRPHETVKRNASLVTVGAKVRLLNALGLILQALERKHAEVLRDLEAFLEMNEEILNPTTRQRTWHYTVLIGLGIAWVLDIIVFGPAAAHVARRGMPYLPILTPLLSLLAALLVPLMLIGIESLLGALVHRYGDRRSPDFHRGKQLAAAFAGICVATSVTAMVLSLDLAGNEAKGGSDSELSYHQIAFYALALTTLALHLTILFLGEKGAAAKDFAVARYKRWKLEGVVAELQKAIEKRRAEFVDLGASYIQEVYLLVLTYGEPVPWGPFCEEALEQFRRHFPGIAVANALASSCPKKVGPASTRPADDDVVIDVPVERFSPKRGEGA